MHLYEFKTKKYTSLYKILDLISMNNCYEKTRNEEPNPEFQKTDVLTRFFASDIFTRKNPFYSNVFWRFCTCKII